MTTLTALIPLVCTERIENPTFNDEFAPVKDGGPCTEPAATKLIIKHGNGCDCGGHCLLDMYTSKPIEPWTEIRLICTDHLYQHGYAAPPDHDQDPSDAVRLVRLDADDAQEADGGISWPGSVQGECCWDQYCSGVYQRRPGTEFEHTAAGFGGILLRCTDCGWDSAEFWPINPK